MAQIYNIISIVAFSLAGVSFLLALFFWFRFKIPKIIGDLSGRTAKKSIEQMRSQNERSGKKSYRTTPATQSRGPLTSAMEQNEVNTLELQKEEKKEQSSVSPIPNKAKMPILLNQGEATTLLNQEVGEKTTLLEGEDNEKTTLLEQTQNTLNKEENEQFEILQSIVFIHTEERI